MNVIDIDPQTFSQLVRVPEVGKWFLESGDSSDYEVTDAPGSIYCAAFEEGTLLMACAQPLNSSAMHIHVAVHPQRRCKTVLAAREALKHIRTTVGGDTTLFALTPSDNVSALALARLLGLKHCGTLHGAYRRNFIRGDLIIHEVLSWPQQQEF